MVAFGGHLALQLSYRARAPLDPRLRLYCSWASRLYSLQKSMLDLKYRLLDAASISISSENEDKGRIFFLHDFGWLHLSRLHRSDL